MELVGKDSQIVHILYQYHAVQYIILQIHLTNNRILLGPEHVVAL